MRGRSRRGETEAGRATESFPSALQDYGLAGQLLYGLVRLVGTGSGSGSGSEGGEERGALRC